MKYNLMGPECPSSNSAIATDYFLLTSSVKLGQVINLCASFQSPVNGDHNASTPSFLQLKTSSGFMLHETVLGKVLSRKKNL